MDESFFRDKLSAYLDQELSPEEMAMMEEYIQSHPEARELLEQLRQLDRLVDEQSQLGDDDYWERSARKIEAALAADAPAEVVDIRAESRWRGLGWRIAVGAASVVLLGYIGLHISDIMPPEDTPPPSDRPAIEYRQESPRETTTDTMRPAADRIEAPGGSVEERGVAVPSSRQGEGGQRSAVQPSGFDELNSDDAVEIRTEEESPKVGIPRPVAEPVTTELPQSVKVQHDADIAAGRTSNEVDELPVPDKPAPLGEAELSRTKARMAELVRKSRLTPAMDEDLEMSDISLSAGPSRRGQDTSAQKKAEEDRLYRRSKSRSLAQKYAGEPSSLAEKESKDTSAAEEVPEEELRAADSIGTGLTAAEEAELADLSFKLANRPQKAGDRAEAVYLLRRLEEWGAPDTRKLARTYLGRLGVPAADH